VGSEAVEQSALSHENRKDDKSRTQRVLLSAAGLSRALFVIDAEIAWCCKGAVRIWNRCC